MQTIFPIKGQPVAKTPGSLLQYEMPDLYDRPWAEYWRKYYEKDMQIPQSDDLFDFGGDQ